MCLAYPYRILEILDPFTAKAEVQGVQKEVYIPLLSEEIKPGDWVLVHIGFAIQRIDEKEAQEILKVYEEFS